MVKELSSRGLVDFEDSAIGDMADPVVKLLILSIGRDIVSSAEAQLNRVADATIQLGEVYPGDYPAVRKQIYEQLKLWSGEEVQLVLSGPLGLIFTLGQLVGLNHFKVSILQYDAEASGYTSVPTPTRREISNYKIERTLQ